MRYWHIRFYSFHFSVLHKYCVFYLFIYLPCKSLWQPYYKQVFWAIFPIAFAHFVSLIHFGKSSKHLNFFIIMFFMAVCEPLMLLLQWFWGAENHAHIRWQTTDKHVGSDCSTNWPFPISLRLLGLFIPWETKHIKISQSITLKRSLIVQVKR